MKKFDVVDLMARSYRVPKSGLPIRDPDSVFYPLENISSRIYNYSDDRRFFVFATEYETFICPFFFGIEDLLKENGFSKVDHNIINVNFGPKMCPRYRNALDPWISNFNAIRKYCIEVSKEIMENEKKFLLLPQVPPKFMEVAKKIPADGIFCEELKKKFYPILCTDFPYVNNIDFRGLYAYKENKGNKENEDSTKTYIIYASDGEVYVGKLPSEYNLEKELNKRGYILKQSLFVPNFDEI